MLQKIIHSKSLFFTFLLLFFAPLQGQAIGSQHAVFLGEKNIHYDPTRQSYNVSMGKVVLDLTGIPSDFKEDIWINLNVIFGAIQIYIDPKQPIRIISDSAFAEVLMPDENVTAFGELLYSSKSAQIENSRTPIIHIEAQAIFGSIHFLKK